MSTTASDAATASTARPSKILGIDLGTTNSAMAVWDGTKPCMVLTANSRSLVPSVVGITEDGKTLVGESARLQGIVQPERTIFSAKRFIGRKFRTVSAADRSSVPYKVVGGEEGETLFQVGHQYYSPEEIASRVLRSMKETAEAFLGEPVTDAVITVPAYFNNPQREATKEAGRLAGLNVRRIVNEPTAAALAYGLDKIEDSAAVVAVYDLGGGTFDVSILSVGDDLVEVIATNGDTHLGGDDVDECVADWLAARLPQGKELAPAAREILREAARGAKVALTAEEKVEIGLELPAREGAAAVHLEATLTRDEFELMISGLVDRSLACCDRALEDAKKLPEDVAAVVLVGGSSRIPLVRRRVAEFFGREPRDQVNPDEVVALGAAVQAGVLAGDIKGVVLVDVTSLSLGIENHEGKAVVVIPRNTSIPSEAKRMFTTSAEGQTSLRFHVVQGESARAAQNESLGQFDLAGLPDAPVGKLRIEVTFAIDSNGMVGVRARDLDTGIAQSVIVSVVTSVLPEAANAAGAAISDEALMDSALAILEEAQTLLATPGRKMTGVDRASLTRRTSELRVLLTGPSSNDELRAAAATLESVVEKVRAFKTPRADPPPSLAHAKI
jgi:molecular chaperone DnaK